MRRHVTPLAAAAFAVGTAASADPFVDAVVRNFQDLGYSFIEIERGPARLEAEGVRGAEKLEVVYDLATGRILSQETGRADSRDMGRTGVRIEDTARATAGGAAPVSVDPTRTGDGFADNVIADLRARGYDFIEIERGATRLKAEGVRGTEELEIIYDLATGRIIKQETGRADPSYIGRTGVEFAVTDDGFDRADDDDDDDDDGSGRDRDRDRDDDDDDHDASGSGRDDGDSSGSGSGGRDDDDSSSGGGSGSDNSGSSGDDDDDDD